MKRFLAATIMGSIVALVPARSVTHDLLPTDVEALVKSFLRQTGTPGVAVAIVRDGKLIYAAGFGRTANGSDITPDTPLRIASMSKSFTALAALQLVAEGHLSLDTPVKKVLPEFHTLDPRSDLVTVRHLLNQTSGLSDLRVNQVLNTRDVTTVQALKSVHQSTLTAPPGQRFEYANINYDLAGVLVEKVSGQRLQDYLQARVFRPLKLQAQLTPNCAEQPERLSSGHTLLLTVALPISEPPGYCLGSGGIIASANDLSRWLTFQMKGDKAVLPDALRLEMHRFPNLIEKPSQRYGMGWYDSSEPGLPARIGHGGNLVSYASYMDYEPVSRVGIVILTNANGPAVLLSRNLFRLMGGQPAMSMRSPTFTIDLALLGIGLLGTLLGLRALRRAGVWVSRVQGKPVWQTMLKLLPFPLLILGVTYAPALMSAPPTAWPTILKLLPSSAALWILALVVLLVLVVRVRLWLALKRRSLEPKRLH